MREFTVDEIRDLVTAYLGGQVDGDEALRAAAAAFNIDPITDPDLLWDAMNERWPALVDAVELNDVDPDERDAYIEQWVARIVEADEVGSQARG